MTIFKKLYSVIILKASINRYERFYILELFKKDLFKIQIPWGDLFFETGSLYIVLAGLELIL